eukprot:UN02590
MSANWMLSIIMTENPQGSGGRGRAYTEVSNDPTFPFDKTYTNYDDAGHITSSEIVFRVDSTAFPPNGTHTDIWVRVESDQASNGAFTLDLQATEKTSLRK